ncbi:MAG TPA: methylcobamide--CoM methyltransferase [Clostridiaceae bacterium]|nr:methylcobamide--CoM methyltransferase [Clostridiaceae bacterium]
MKWNMKNWMLDISNSTYRKAMPIMTYPGLPLVNKTITEVVKSGKSQYECIKALADKYPSAAAVTIMDLSVEAEAFGSAINYSDEDVPTVSARIVRDIESVNALKIPAMGDGRTAEYVKAAELASQNIMDRPVFGGQIGPFSLAARLYDMTEIMVDLLLEPEVIHALLNKTTEFLIAFAKAFKEAGANGIIMAEPAAGLLSPSQCDEFSSAYVKRIVDAVQDEYFMVILHNCGNTTNLVPSLLSTGAMGFHFGNAVNMMDILPQITEDRIAFGNIDPARVFKNGTAEDVRNKTWELLEKAEGYKNFVISSGCDIPPGTPVENIDAFFNTVELFNKTKRSKSGTEAVAT